MANNQHWLLIYQLLNILFIQATAAILKDKIRVNKWSISSFLLQ